MNWHEYITKAWELRATAKPSLLKDMSDTHRTLAEACPMLAIVGIVETKIFKSWTHHGNNKNDNQKNQYERKKIIIRRHHYDVHSISFHYRWILFFCSSLSPLITFTPDSSSFSILCCQSIEICTEVFGVLDVYYKYSLYRLHLYTTHWHTSVLLAYLFAMRLKLLKFATYKTTLLQQQQKKSLKSFEHTQPGLPLRVVFPRRSSRPTTAIRK